MASIRKRGSSWSVQVRRRGFPPQSKTCATKAEAQAWARSVEASIDRQEVPVDDREIRQTTLGDLMRRYRDGVTPHKRSAETEHLRMGKMLTAPVFSLSLSRLTTSALAAYRDARLGAVKAGTLLRELSLIRRVLVVAAQEWGVAVDTTVIDRLAKPRLNNARDTRLEPGDLQKLEAAFEGTRNPLIRPLVLFAIETAMRRGELLNLRWRDINVNRRTAFIPKTKTDRPRTIPLTTAALEILARLPRDDERVFPLTPVAVRLAWDRLRARAGLDHLHFHDLRHESISRFAELGLTTAQLGLISGHRDPRMLQRYTHLNPADLAAKLADRSWDREVCGA